MTFCLTYKDSASRAENKTKTEIFVFYPEAKPILPEAHNAEGNDSASRAENKTKTEIFVFYPEAKPILPKKHSADGNDSASRTQC